MPFKILAALLSLWLCAVASACAQETPNRDPIAQTLIGPDVVMNHQQALGLSDAQKNAIQVDVLNAQARFTRAQFQLQAASEKLVELLKKSRVDQTKALAQLDALLALEREIKHTQLTLMIQIKNELTPEQQAQARQFAPSGGK
ncbi:MAG TPA: hypothetical protein VKG44_06055 [Candidatus Baltobacteraceae bacterium]|nr:hypothetical protein [Candidatus Baltobacteraceae bacterium]